MAVLPLTIIGDPILRRPAEPVREITEEIRRLVEDMFETMHANNGVGLAANQVGVGLRVAVLGIPEKGERIRHLALINPEWSNPEGEASEDEGCLSVPGIYEELKRVRQVDCRALNERGEPIEFTCEGLLARAVQHEVDHLNGVLFVDRLGPLRRQRLKRDLKALEEGRGVAPTRSGGGA
jgi:peptide deformylase